MFVEILTGSPLFPGRDEMDQMEKICQIMGSPTEKTMPGVSKLPWQHLLYLLKQDYRVDRLIQVLHYRGVRDTTASRLITNLLRLDPAQRFTARQALEVITVPSSMLSEDYTSVYKADTVLCATGRVF